MGLTKRTYALPEGTVERFETAVSRGRRSSVLARLMLRWVEEQERAALGRAVVEGSREMSEVYLEVEREYHPLEEEVERSFDPHPPTR